MRGYIPAVAALDLLAARLAFDIMNARMIVKPLPRRISTWVW